MFYECRMITVASLQQTLTISSIRPQSRPRTKNLWSYPETPDCAVRVAFAAALGAVGHLGTRRTERLTSARRAKVKTKNKYVRGMCRAVSLVGYLGVTLPVQASEFGIGGYFLGLTFPFAGYTPAPGVYFRDTFFMYHGSFGPDTQRSTYNILADIGIIAWYPEWDFFGASPGFAAVVPYVGVRNKFQSISTGPNGTRQFDSSTQTANSIGDTEYSAMLGWRSGEHHWNVSLTGFMPTGRYKPYELSITGLNRPGVDLRGAYTYFGVETGLEVSAALGVLVNGMNTATNYQSGAEMHFEWALHQHFPFGLFVGATGFVFQQLTGDSGPGAIYGPYIGRTFAVGPSIGYSLQIDGRKLDLAARWYHEFGVVNRPRGDGVFAQLGFRF